jgi:hypothetical protein
MHACFYFYEIPNSKVYGTAQLGQFDLLMLVVGTKVAVSAK